MKFVALLVVVLLAVGIFFYLHRGNTRTIEVKYPDGSTETVKVNDRSCQMVGWQDKVGWNFSFDILKRYQGSGGFNFDDSQARQLDDLQTDFGMQFEALCKDYLTGIYKGREALYDCRRSNVGSALTALRELKITLEPVKTMQDAAAQKDSVKTALAKYYEVSANNFSRDCTPRALGIDRNELRFNPGTNLQDARISNGGYFEMIWELANTPHNFHCEGDSYKLVPSGFTTLHVYRLFGDVDAGSQTITINNNFKETADLKIVVDDGNSSKEQIINEIQGNLNSAPNQDLATVTLATVKKNYPTASEGVVNWVSGELLDKMGNPGAAKLVLQKAGQDPKLKEQPQFKLDLGAVLAKTGEKNQSDLLLDDVSRHKDRYFAMRAATLKQTPSAPEKGENVVVTPEKGSPHQLHISPAVEQVKSSSGLEKARSSVPK